jgi:hypothetical protein
MKLSLKGTEKRRNLLLVVSVVLLLLLGLDSAAPSAQKSKRSVAAPRRVDISEIHSTEKLKEAFERDTGKVRLVALLSPT